MHKEREAISGRAASRTPEPRVRDISTGETVAKREEYKGKIRRIMDRVTFRKHSILEDVMDHYNRITGMDLSLPDVQFHSGLGAPNLFLGTITLNIFSKKATVVHEAAHSYRERVLYGQDADPLEILASRMRESISGKENSVYVWEACAIFAEAAYPSLNEGTRNLKLAEKILDRLSRYLEGNEKMAVRLIEEFYRLEKVKGGKGRPKQPELWKLLNTAIENVEGKTKAVPFLDSGREAVKYLVASGLAMLLFVSNNLDVEKTLKQALTQSDEQLLGHLANALKNDEEGKIQRKIEEVRLRNNWLARLWNRINS